MNNKYIIASNFDSNNSLILGKEASSGDLVKIKVDSLSADSLAKIDSYNNRLFWLEPLNENEYSAANLGELSERYISLTLPVSNQAGICSILLNEQQDALSSLDRNLNESMALGYINEHLESSIARAELPYNVLANAPAGAEIIVEHKSGERNVINVHSMYRDPIGANEKSIHEIAPDLLNYHKQGSKIHIHNTRVFQKSMQKLGRSVACLRIDRESNKFSLIEFKNSVPTEYPATNTGLRNSWELIDSADSPLFSVVVDSNKVKSESIIVNGEEIGVSVHFPILNSAIRADVEAAFKACGKHAIIKGSKAIYAGPDFKTFLAHLSDHLSAPALYLNHTDDNQFFIDGAVNHPSVANFIGHLQTKYSAGSRFFSNELEASIERELKDFEFQSNFLRTPIPHPSSTIGRENSESKLPQKADSEKMIKVKGYKPSTKKRNRNKDGKTRNRSVSLGKWAQLRFGGDTKAIVSHFIDELAQEALRCRIIINESAFLDEVDFSEGATGSIKGGAAITPDKSQGNATGVALKYSVSSYTCNHSGISIPSFHITFFAPGLTNGLGAAGKWNLSSSLFNLYKQEKSNPEFVNGEVKPPSEEEKRKSNEKRRQAIKRVELREKKQEAERLQSRNKSYQLYKSLSKPTSSHPVIVKKGIHGIEELDDVRAGINKRANKPYLMLPYYKLNGEIAGFQEIYAEEIATKQGQTNKRFTYGSIRGGDVDSHHVIGDIQKSDTIFYVEGYADGASVYLCRELLRTKYGEIAVVVCGDLNHIASLNQKLAQIYPQKKHINVADNDVRSDRIKRNGGAYSAVDLSYRGGIEFVLPSIPGRVDKTDINDVYKETGAHETARQLLSTRSISNEKEYLHGLLEFSGTEKLPAVLKMVYDYFSDESKGYDPTSVAGHLATTAALYYDKAAIDTALREAGINIQSKPTTSGEIINDANIASVDTEAVLSICKINTTDHCLLKINSDRVNLIVGTANTYLRDFGIKGDFSWNAGFQGYVGAEAKYFDAINAKLSRFTGAPKLVLNKPLEKKSENLTLSGDIYTLNIVEDVLKRLSGYRVEYNPVLSSFEIQPPANDKEIRRLCADLLEPSKLYFDTDIENENERLLKICGVLPTTPSRIQNSTTKLSAFNLDINFQDYPVIAALSDINNADNNLDKLANLLKDIEANRYSTFLARLPENEIIPQEVVRDSLSKIEALLEHFEESRRTAFFHEVAESRIEALQNQNKNIEQQISATLELSDDAKLSNLIKDYGNTRIESAVLSELMTEQQDKPLPAISEIEALVDDATQTALKHRRESQAVLYIDHINEYINNSQGVLLDGKQDELLTSIYKNAHLFEACNSLENNGVTGSVLQDFKTKLLNDSVLALGLPQPENTIRLNPGPDTNLKVLAKIIRTIEFINVLKETNDSLDDLISEDWPFRYYRESGLFDSKLFLNDLNSISNRKDTLEEVFENIEDYSLFESEDPVHIEMIEAIEDREAEWANELSEASNRLKNLINTMKVGLDNEYDYMEFISSLAVSEGEPYANQGVFDTIAFEDDIETIFEHHPFGTSFLNQSISTPRALYLDLSNSPVDAELSNDLDLFGFSAESKDDSVNAELHIEQFISELKYFVREGYDLADIMLLMDNQYINESTPFDEAALINDIHNQKQFSYLRSYIDGSSFDITGLMKAFDTTPEFREAEERLIALQSSINMALDRRMEFEDYYQKLTSQGGPYVNKNTFNHQTLKNDILIARSGPYKPAFIDGSTSIVELFCNIRNIQSKERLNWLDKYMDEFLSKGSAITFKSLKNNLVKSSGPYISSEGKIDFDLIQFDLDNASLSYSSMMNMFVSKGGKNDNERIAKEAIDDLYKEIPNFKDTTRSSYQLVQQASVGASFELKAYNLESEGVSVIIINDDYVLGYCDTENHTKAVELVTNELDELQRDGIEFNEAQASGELLSIREDSQLIYDIDRNSERSIESIGFESNVVAVSGSTGNWPLNIKDEINNILYSDSADKITALQSLSSSFQLKWTEKFINQLIASTSIHADIGKDMRKQQLKQLLLENKEVIRKNDIEYALESTVMMQISPYYDTKRRRFNKELFLSDFPSGISDDFANEVYMHNVTSEKPVLNVHFSPVEHVDSLLALVQSNEIKLSSNQKIPPFSLFLNSLGAMDSVLKSTSVVVSMSDPQGYLESLPQYELVLLADIVGVKIDENDTPSRLVDKISKAVSYISTYGKHNSLDAELFNFDFNEKNFKKAFQNNFKLKNAQYNYVAKIAIAMKNGLELPSYAREFMERFRINNEVISEHPIKDSVQAHNYWVDSFNRKSHFLNNYKKLDLAIAQAEFNELNEEALKKEGVHYCYSANESVVERLSNEKALSQVKPRIINGLILTSLPVPNHLIDNYQLLPVNSEARNKYIGYDFERLVNTTQTPTTLYSDDLSVIITTNGRSREVAAYRKNETGYERINGPTEQSSLFEELNLYASHSNSLNGLLVNRALNEDPIVSSELARRLISSIVNKEYLADQNLSERLTQALESYSIEIPENSDVLALLRKAEDIAHNLGRKVIHKPLTKRENALLASIADILTKPNSELNPNSIIVNADMASPVFISSSNDEYILTQHFVEGAIELNMRDFISSGIRSYSLASLKNDLQSSNIHSKVSAVSFCLSNNVNISNLQALPKEYLQKSIQIKGLGGEVIVSTEADDILSTELSHAFTKMKYVSHPTPKEAYTETAYWVTNNDVETLIIIDKGETVKALTKDSVNPADTISVDRKDVLFDANGDGAKRIDRFIGTYEDNIENIAKHLANSKSIESRFCSCILNKLNDHHSYLKISNGSIYTMDNVLATKLSNLLERDNLNGFIYDLNKWSANLQIPFNLANDIENSENAGLIKQAYLDTHSELDRTTDQSRIENNIKALKAMQSKEAETDIVLYTGWNGIEQYLPTLSSRHPELDFQNKSHSIQVPVDIVTSMWKAIQNNKLNFGRAMIANSAQGQLIAHAPEDSIKTVQAVCFEEDKNACAINDLLVKSHIVNSSLGSANLPDSSFDIGLGAFSMNQLTEIESFVRYTKKNSLAIAYVSNSLFDSEHRAIRENISKHAVLVSAVNIPKDTKYSELDSYSLLAFQHADTQIQQAKDFVDHGIKGAINKLDTELFNKLKSELKYANTENVSDVEVERLALLKIFEHSTKPVELTISKSIERVRPTTEVNYPPRSVNVIDSDVHISYPLLNTDGVYIDRQYPHYQERQNTLLVSDYVNLRSAFISAFESIDESENGKKAFSSELDNFTFKHGSLNNDLSASVLKDDPYFVNLKYIEKHLVNGNGQFSGNPLHLKESNLPSVIATNSQGCSVKALLNTADNMSSIEPRLVEQQKIVRKALPMPYVIEQIDFSISQNWIPQELIKDFLNKYLDNENSTCFQRVEDIWVFNSKDRNSAKPAKVKEVLQALNNDKLLKFNAKGTLHEVISVIENSWQEYISESTQRIATIENAFNDRFNHFVRPGYHNNPIAITSNIAKDEISNPQELALRRYLANGSLISERPTNTGQQKELALCAIEGRKQGMHNTPIILADNDNMDDIQSAILDLYPGAALTIITSNDLNSKPGINEAITRINSYDWDAVIAPKSIISKLRPGEAFCRSMIRNSELNKSNNKFINDIQKHLISDDNDLFLDVDKTNIDAILVDNANDMMGLRLDSSAPESPGLNSAQSTKALKLFALARYIQHNNDGKGVMLFSNSDHQFNIVDTYNKLRIVSPEALKVSGINNYDDFLTVFGDIDTSTGQAHLNGIKNAAALRTLLASNFDLLNASAALKLREEQRNRRQFVNTNRVAARSQYVEAIAEKAQALKNSDASKLETDKFLSLAQGFAIEPRFAGFNNHLSMDGNGKIELLISDLKNNPLKQNEIAVAFCDHYANTDISFDIFNEFQNLANNEPFSVIDQTELQIDRIDSMHGTVILAKTNDVEKMCSAGIKADRVYHVDIPTNEADMNYRESIGKNTEEKIPSIAFFNQQSLDVCKLINYGSSNTTSSFLYTTGELPSKIKQDTLDLDSVIQSSLNPELLQEKATLESQLDRRESESILRKRKYMLNSQHDNHKHSLVKRDLQRLLGDVNNNNNESKAAIDWSASLYNNFAHVPSTNTSEVLKLGVLGNYEVLYDKTHQVLMISDTDICISDIHADDILNAHSILKEHLASDISVAIANKSQHEDIAVAEYAEIIEEPSKQLMSIQSVFEEAVANLDKGAWEKSVSAIDSSVIRKESDFNLN